MIILNFYWLYNLYFVDKPCIIFIAELSIRKPGSSSVLIISIHYVHYFVKITQTITKIKITNYQLLKNYQLFVILLALMKIRVYGSKALQ